MRSDKGFFSVLFVLTISSVMLLSCALLLPKPVLALNESVTTTTQTVSMLTTTTLSATYTVTSLMTTSAATGWTPTPDDLIELFHSQTVPIMPIEDPISIKKPDYGPLITSVAMTGTGVLVLIGIVGSLYSKELALAVLLPLNRLSARIRTRRP